MSTHTIAPAWIPADTFASRLVLVRRELGITVKEAADRAGLHYATWSTWENGRKPSDMDDVVNAIADALGVDKVWLMWGKETAPRPGGGDGGAVSDLAKRRTRRYSKPQPSDPKVTRHHWWSGRDELGRAA